MEISDLLSSLSESDIEQLKQSAASLLGGLKMEGNNHALEGDVVVESAGDSKSDFDGGLDLGLTQVLSKMGGVIDTPDVRCDFLLALKPLLREEHRERVDQAVKMLRLMNMLPMLKEGGLLKNFLM